MVLLLLPVPMPFISKSQLPDKNKMAEAHLLQRLKGKVAIITGAASGIGEATARLFADHGAHVILADVQDELGRAVAASIGPGRATYVRCDVTDEDQIRHLVQTAVSAHGRVDVAFANAGVKHRGQATLDLDLFAMDGLFAVNVRGAAGLVKHAGRAMVEKGVEGSIICTASAASVVGGTSADYTMSKHAVLGLVRSACHDLGKHGIRVNCVSPYAVATPLLRGLYEGGVEELESMFSRRTSLQGRVLNVRHVADAALFLASDDSAFVSGHNLVVDGGFVSVRF